MRLPAAIRPWLCALVAAAGFGAAGSLRAQFAGGQADGYAISGVTQVMLDGSATGSPAYFSSGTGGDGYALAGRSHVPLDGTTQPAVPFTATLSGGDGYDTAGLRLHSLDGTTLPSAVFTASLSGGDGYDARGFSSRRLDGAADFSDAYAGSPIGGDGYDRAGLLDAPFDPSLAYEFIFNGGAGDGYDVRGLAITALDGAVPNPSPYVSSGTGGDGYDLRGLALYRLDGAPPVSELYLSSSTGGDGYDRAGMIHQSLSGEPQFVTTYLGAQGDGFDSAGLRNLALDPASLPPVAVYEGNQGDGYHLATAPSIYWLGQDGEAFPMTYAIWRALQFTQEEADAGLDADIADLDHDGLPNLLEYTLGSDPRTPDFAVYGPQIRVSNLSDLGLRPLPQHHLIAIVRRNPRIFDARLAVEVSDDPGSLWDSQGLIPVDSLPSIFIVRDPMSIKTAPRRMMRLRATLLP